MLGVNEETRDERKKGSAPFIVIIPSRRTSKERKEKLVKTERERNGASAATTAGRAKAAMCWPFGVVYGTPRLSWNNYYILAVPKKTLFSKVLSRYEDKFARRTRKKESCAPMHQDTQQTVDINSAFSFLYIQRRQLLSSNNRQPFPKGKFVEPQKSKCVWSARPSSSTPGQGKKKEKKKTEEEKKGWLLRTDRWDRPFPFYIYIASCVHPHLSLSLSLSLYNPQKVNRENREK